MVERTHRQELILTLIAQKPIRNQGELLNELRAEHHYYAFGRASGVIAWLIVVIVIKEVLF